MEMSRGEVPGQGMPSPASYKTFLKVGNFNLDIRAQLFKANIVS